MRKRFYIQEKMNYRSQDASSWNTSEVYRLYDLSGVAQNTYLLCYDSILVEIAFDFEPTETQKEVVYRKLHEPPLH